MEELYQWVRDVFFIIISMTFFRILIPDSSMNKYVSFVFSLVILAVIMEPIAHII